MKRTPLNLKWQYALWVFCGKYTVDQAAGIMQVTSATMRSWVDAYGPKALAAFEAYRKEEGDGGDSR